MITKYSAAYISNTENFAILHKDPKRISVQFQNSQLHAVFCVVQNIIQRGTPTRLSEYLKEYFDEEEVADSNYLLSAEAAFWNRTIKGDQGSSYYPAIEFYNEIISDYLGEYAFIKNLIIPEADFDDVIGTETAFSGQQVDFFIPVISTVIEIDGSSHNEQGQIALDSARDEELINHGIKVIRIKTSDIRKKTSVIKETLSDLKRTLEKNETVQAYKDSLQNKQSVTVIKLEAIMRLQIMLLHCLREQLLDFDSEKWRVHFSYSDTENIEDLLLIAYEDIQQWMKPIFGMLKIECAFPKIEIVTDKRNADIVLDYSLYQRYDDTCILENNIIYIRTGYYRGRDFYRVAVANALLRYDLQLEEPSEDVRRMEFLLQNIFGFSDGFTEGQIPIIENVLAGNDTIGILPTGSGKSLCYQFASLLQPGVTVVVDPIISLMIDQKHSMHDSYQITHNEMVSSMQTGEEKSNILDNFQKGYYQIIWVSPERFQIQEFRDSLSEINRKLNFCLAVIDEVHCLSEWGHDFRVSYLALVKTMRDYCPTAVLMGLTATASQFVLEDIKVEFADDNGAPLDVANVKTSYSMGRSELVFKRIPVHNQTERVEKVKDLLRENKSFLRNSNDDQDNDQCLIFCPTVGGQGTGCNTMNQVLLGEGISCGVFHGQMGQGERQASQNDFMDNAFQYMVCTKAFGMGVDNRRIWCTIHCSLPASIESFYQEAGRAGRDRKRIQQDGKIAHCYIIYNIFDSDRKIVNRYAEGHGLIELLSEENRATVGRGDLGTPLYFLSSNFLPEEEESAYIKKLLDHLFSNGGIVPFDQTVTGDNRQYYDKQLIEKALYKLSQLGFVTDWTVRYLTYSSGLITAKYADTNAIELERIRTNFLQYVQKYDEEFSLDRGDGIQYQKLFNDGDDKTLNLIRMLVRWTNENIVYQRINCLATIMNWCSSSVSDEEFRENVVGYFRFSDKTLVLENIAHDPLDFVKWFGCLRDDKGGYIDKTTARELYAGLQRFLESYRNNTGLNYLDGLLQLYVGSVVSEDDLGRMKRSLEVIREMDDGAQEFILDETLRWGKTIDNIEIRDLLSKILLAFFPEKTRKVFNALNDRYSLSLELNEVVNRMENIKWII